MNKVVSIEIAGQVFWTEEEAYEVLSDYLKKIRLQLSAEEEAIDILKDIELRVAELLYAFRSDDKKAISVEQVNEVIEQVGFIDSDLEAVEIPRRFFLDQQNKIIAGVCAGLALRFRVPAFVVRLIFLLLTPLAGLGIILYLVFWMSFDSNTSRNAVLAAQGKAQTARSIAEIGNRSSSAAHQIQRIVFLPFSLVGALLTVVADHIKKRSGAYLLVLKNIVAIVLLGLAAMVCVSLYFAYQERVFPALIGIALIIAAMYLVVLVLAIYFRDYYLANPHFQVSRVLKLGAVLPVGILIAAFVYLANAWDVYLEETIERSYTLAGDTVNLQINDELPQDSVYGRVRVRIRTNDSTNQLRIAVNYSAYGFNEADADENLRNAEYVYAFDGNTLELDDFWRLSDGELSRDQRVNVLIEVPQNVTTSSPWPLTIRREGSSYIYSVAQTGRSPFSFNGRAVRYVNPVVQSGRARISIIRSGFAYSYPAARHFYEDGGSYLASGDFFHEIDDGFQDRLSDNERLVLQDKFCQEFYISEYRGCSYHIEIPVAENNLFDRAFEEDLQTIEQVRNFLLPNRSLFVSNLYEVNDLIQGLSVDQARMSEFQEYLLHLAEVKTNSRLL